MWPADNFSRMPELQNAYRPVRKQLFCSLL
jgi:hypothetical protein